MSGEGSYKKRIKVVGEGPVLARAVLTDAGLTITKATEPDPNEGWIPLAPGCAMPEIGDEVDVTFECDAEDRWAERAMYFEGEFINRCGDSYPAPTYTSGAFRSGRDCRATAWRPAPAPYRGAK